MMTWSTRCLLGMLVVFCAYGMAEPVRAVVVPETEGFCYDDFSSVDGLVLLGSAAQDGNTIRLNASLQNTFGHAWAAERQSVVNGFRTSFEFSVSEMVSSGADLIDFIVQAHGTVPTTQGVAVRVDTFQNPGEPNGNFASVLRDCCGLNSLHAFGPQ